MGVHSASLDLRQGVEGVPELNEQFHPIQKFLGRRLMQAGCVFNPIVAVQRIERLVVAHPFGMGRLTPPTGIMIILSLILRLSNTLIVFWESLPCK